MKLQLLLVFVLAACVAFPGYANDPADETQSEPVVQLQPDEPGLTKRVSSRWDALIAKDFTRAYAYFSPAYRELFPLEHYLRESGTNVDWVSIDIQDSAVDGNRAEVKMTLAYRFNPSPGAGFGMIDDIGLITKNITEIWLWKSGNWWYINPRRARL